MKTADLGRIYHDGEVIVRKGDKADCMYVVQSGEVVVLLERACDAVSATVTGAHHLSVLKSGESFGEMSLFTKQARSATVVARGTTRVLRIDKRSFLRRVHEDPSIAFQILRKLSERICALNDEVERLRNSQC